ncbi:hypothetical protein MBLNU457_4196t1 [Dothideomycetes sp. NU457]
MGPVNIEMLTSSFLNDCGGDQQGNTWEENIMKDRRVGGLTSASEYLLTFRYNPIHTQAQVAVESRDETTRSDDLALPTPSNIATYQDLVSPDHDHEQSSRPADTGHYEKKEPSGPFEHRSKSTPTFLAYSILGSRPSIPAPASFVTTLEYGGSIRIHSRLCAAYIANVDPIFKVLHKPSITAHITHGQPYLGHSANDLNVQALDYAVFFAAVNTLDEDECMSMFGVAKSRVVEGYRAASEAALGYADFVLNHNLVLLQAFVIHLAATRITDKTHRVWTLLSLALRMAQSLGLLLDTASSTINPFEREQRRRLLVAIGLLDVQAAVEKASESMILGSWLVNSIPLNIADADIWPDMISEPTARQGFTDSTFLLLTTKTQILARFLCFSASPDPQHNEWTERQARLNAFQQEIAPWFATEDPQTRDSAWYWYARTTAECIVAWMQLMAVRPLRQQIGVSAPVINHVDLLKLAVKVLEETHKIVRDPRGIPWRWYGGFFAPWHALAVSLAELCVCHDVGLLNACWPIIQVSFFRMNDIVPEHNGDTVWEPMLRLMKRAEQKMSSITLPDTVGETHVGFHSGYPPTNNAGPEQAAIIDTSSLPTYEAPVDDFFDIWPDLGDSAVNIMTNVSSTSTDEIAWASWEDFIHDYNQTDGMIMFN